MDEKKMLKGENFLSVWRRELLIAAFALSIAVTIIFGVRAFHQAPHKKVDQRIRPWMSVKYVARAHRVPPQVLYEALALPPAPRDKRSIKQIARAQNLPVEEVIIALQKAIERAQPLSSPTPGFTPSPPGISGQPPNSR
jgi:hypothetical protein